MPYIPPHLRKPSYYDEKAAPKIATSLAEADAMAKAVVKEAPKSALASMLSAPKPKKAIAAAKRDKRPIHTPNETTLAALKESRSIQTNASTIASSQAKPVAAGSFGSMLPTPAPEPVKAKQSQVKKVLAATPANTEVQKAALKTDPRYEAAMDDVLRTIFEDEIKGVKRVGNVGTLNFRRRPGGSYFNERLESRFQGFKLQKLEEISGDVSEKLENILRARFELAMANVKRVGNAGPLNFSRRSGGSYQNERLESRFQGYMMGSLNDFGLSVLKKVATNRVAALSVQR